MRVIEHPLRTVSPDRPVDLHVSHSAPIHGRLACGCAFSRSTGADGSVRTVIDDVSRCRARHAAGWITQMAARRRAGAVLPARPLF